MKELPDAERVGISDHSLLYFTHLCPHSPSCSANSWTVSPYTTFRDVFSCSNAFIGVESAAFPGQSPEEIDRLLHLVCTSPLYLAGFYR